MKPDNSMNPLYTLTALLVTLAAGSVIAFQSQPSLFLLGLVFGSGFFYTLAYNGQHNTRLALSSFLLAFLLSLPFLLHGASPDYDAYIGWLLLLPSAFYITHCFHTAFHEKSGLRIDYRDLFYPAWNTILILFIASLFTLFLNILIQLLIAMILPRGINEFPVFYDYYLVFTKAGLSLIGIGIIKEHLELIYKTRLLALGLAWFIYPIIMVLSFIAQILYLLTWLTKGNTEIPILYVLTFFVLGVLFFNAVFQEGKRLPAYPSVLAGIAELYPLSLSFSGIIIFFTFIRVPVYTPNLWLLLSLALLYGTGYGLTTFFREEKQCLLIKGLNIVLALYFVLVALVINCWTVREAPSKPMPAVTSGSQPREAMPAQNFTNPDVSPEQKKKLRLVAKTQLDTLSKKGLLWKSFYPGQQTLTEQAAICQVPYNKGFEPGSIIEEQCVITYGGKIVIQEQFLYLDFSDTQAHWEAFPSKSALPLGIEFIPEKLASTDPGTYLRPLYACRVSLNKHAYIGKIVDNACNIAYMGVEKSVFENIQVLASTSSK